MTIIKCPNNHSYNSNLYQSCPYCENENIVWVDLNVTQMAKKPDNEEDSGKTRIIGYKGMGSTNIIPTVGWLVCVNGPEKGNDYCIKSKINTVGRSKKMDIRIKDDDTISEETNMRISYENKYGTFMLIPPDSGNVIYLNDKDIYMPTKLSSHDRIEIGKTMLMFIPLCDEKFCWEDTVNGKE